MKYESRVTCGHCKGAGTVVHRRQTRALNLLVPLEVWTETKWIARKMRISETNAANVMRALLKAGQVQRRGSGSRHSSYEWRV